MGWRLFSAQIEFKCVFLVHGETRDHRNTCTLHVGLGGGGGWGEGWGGGRETGIRQYAQGQLYLLINISMSVKSNRTHYKKANRMRFKCSLYLLVGRALHSHSAFIFPYV